MPDDDFMLYPVDDDIDQDTDRDPPQVNPVPQPGQHPGPQPGYPGYPQYPGGYPGGYPGYPQYPGYPGYPQAGVPTAPPPTYVPRKPIGYQNPYNIRRCVGRMGYMWLFNGQHFWAWLTFAGPRVIQGYRWRRNRWTYFQANINEVETFICY